MAVHNGEPYLREAIESVLTQSMTDFEFLIVDDASTDETASILAEYRSHDSRIRVFHNASTLGPFPSTNLGLRHALGEFVARHDADDISCPERFAVQLEALRSDPGVCLVSGPLEIFGGDRGEVIRIHRPETWQPRLEWELLFVNAAGTGANVMFPRVFRGTPVLFPARHAYAEDYGLWCSLSRLGRVVFLPEVVYRYRQHGSSITGRKKAEQDDCFSRIRHEYQSHYLRSIVGRHTSTELSRFWTTEGSRPLAEDVERIVSVLTELSENFLTYIEQRYGRLERATREAELDRTVCDLLGYWLYRSMKTLDKRACGEVLSLAGSRGKGVNVAGKAVELTASAVLRRLRRRSSERQS